MSWSVVNAADVEPQRWRNGGGLTRELLAWPHAADWLLRVSVADIEADGPFSAFPGVERWFGVLAGQGVRLFEGAAACELRMGDALLEFDGGLAPACQLLGGPTRDLNVMHRRGAGRLTVLPCSQPLLPTGRWLGLFTAHAGALHHGGRVMPLEPMSLAWCEQPAAQRCEFDTVLPATAWWLQWQAAEEGGA